MGENFDVPKVVSKIKKRNSEHVEAVDGNEVVTESVAYFEKSLSMEAGKFYYRVKVVTGKLLDAGTTENAYIELVGDKGRTPKLSLQGWHHFMVGKNTCNNLTIVTESDLGKVLVVVVGCDKSHSQQLFKDDWYVDFVTVVNLQLQEVDQFPCYHWIGRNSYVLITAKTNTKKDVADSKILIQQRENQINQRQEVYKWSKDDRGIPSTMDDTVVKLPADEQFRLVKDFDFKVEALKSVGGLDVAGLFMNVKDLHGYEVLARFLGGERPLYEAGRWTSDEEFGRQMLNGVNPIVIQKCEEIPPNFPVTNDMVGSLLENSLEEEMKAGHIYICDMKVMDGLKSRKNYYNVAPICMLYVNKKKKLVPIAIQLKQGIKEEEKTNNPIFTPSDSWIDWIVAKVYYQSAHSQFHQAFTHYVSCHATMEAYSVGTQRNLPDPHPIFKLLVPHLRYTIAINSRARKTLINPGGIIDSFFGIGGEGLTEAWKRFGGSYNIHTGNIKLNTMKRGVDDAEQLPGYYFRDDGIKVWDALEQYAGEIIDEYYQSDADVENDVELAAWARDIHYNGFPAYRGSPTGHGFPEKISSKEELKSYCTLIMFTGSAQHASVNFMQYYYYRFSPNAPFGVRRPPPAKKGVADFQFLLNALPDEKAAINSIGTTHLLSQYSTNETFLGDFHHSFTEKSHETSLEKLKDTLKDVSKQINERNEKLPIELQYTAMLPEKIPNSITI